MLAAAILLLGSAGITYAQNVFGSIFGTVTDASGSAIANAKVTITDVNKGTVSEVMTNETGNYSKGQLIPGTYRVIIEAAGFAKTASNDLIVQVDAAARFDAPLQVGDVSTQVEVTAAAPLLQSDRADVSQTLTQQQINDLPNIGRNLQAFELLNPGTAKLGWQHASDENPQGSVQLVTNGQLFDSQGYILDGTVNQDPILGIIIINPNIDSISEVKQANQDFDSEFEYTGAGLAIYSTKSGSNSYHGDAFEYLQLNTPGFTDFGRDPFSQPNGAPLYRENQFGGSIGGKILKDKLFFFGDAELVREAQGGSVLTNVPTAAERTGDLSAWLNPSYGGYKIYDPTTGDPATGIGRTAFPNNVIPASRISPQAAALLNYFPLPNTNGGAPFNNYAVNGDVGITANKWDTRWDYYLNQKNSIFGRYSYGAFTEQAPGAFGEEAGGPNVGNYAGSSATLNQNVAIGWTNTVSPTLINEVRFGWVRYHVNDVPNGYGTTPAADIGIPGLNLDKTYTSGLPAFYINDQNGASKLGYALGVNQCNCPLNQIENQWQMIDNLTQIHGNHSVKLGIDLRYANNLRVPSDSHRAGELNFNSSTTGSVSTVGGGTTGGDGLATFLLGDVSTFNRYVSSSTDAMEEQKRFFFYGQDEWRITPKLTFTYGMRWEMIFPETVNANGNGATLDPSTGLMYVFGEGGISSHGIQTMNYHDFEPRIGLAYQINPKTVIRAGYGWAYDLGTFGSTFGHNVTQNPPVLSNQSVNPANGFSDVFTLSQGPSLPAPVTISPTGTFALPDGINVKYRPATVTLPTVYMYNLSLQRQITSKFAVTAAYVGNVTRHGWLGTSNNVNTNEALFVPGVSNTNLDKPFYSKFGWTQGLSYYCDCSNEQYNSLQATFKINAAAGYTLQGSYTYQRSWGDGWGAYDPNYYFLYDRAAGQGYNSNLPRNQLTLLQNYDVPFGRGRKFGTNSNKIVDLALGGWNVSGITTFYSGLPFDPVLGNGYTGQPNTGPSNRPDIGSGSPYAGAQGNRNQWFVGETAAQLASGTGPFLLPAANTFGNYPIGTLFGPHFIQQDISLKKTFKVTERFGLTFRGDATNMFNHTNLGGPNNNLQSPQAGQITGLAFGGNNMRKLQFSGTVNF
jgi:hypothetical protein